jgi:hypothetical protein
MAFGLQVYSPSGALRLSVDSYVHRVYASGLAIGVYNPATFAGEVTVLVPGMDTDYTKWLISLTHETTWEFVPGGFKIYAFTYQYRVHWTVYAR